MIMGGELENKKKLPDISGSITGFNTFELG